MQMTLNQLAEFLNLATPHSNVVFNGLSIDTRTLTKGSLYIAIRGETLDGHQFVNEAWKKGASAALVDHPQDCDIPQIVVPDTIMALGTLASKWRDQFTCPLVGVTGSNGKTTLKNMIGSILLAACNGDKKQVLATEGNFNNTIGLPLNLARLTPEHRFGVLEMGMNSFGEIAYLSQLTRPAVAVITNAAESHLEGVSDVEGVARAKGEIFKDLTTDGVAILNKDDEFYYYWLSLIGERKHYSFALNNDADVTAEWLESDDPKVQLIKIITPIGFTTVKLNLAGKHNVANAIAACAVALALNLELKTIKEGLENVAPAYGRMNYHYLHNNICVIDDSYNANPFSLKAAIATLANINQKKILVLGDMKELGKQSEEYHRQAGLDARAAGIDTLLTYGKLTADTAQAFGEHALHFADQNLLISALQSQITPNCTVLIKGSRSMKMEKIVAQLL